MVALILAAGYATRLYPYTKNTPKPLLKVRGKYIIDYIVEQIMALPNISKLIVVTNNKFYGQFEAWRGLVDNELIRIVNDGTNSVDDRLGAIGDIRFSLEAESVDDDLLVIAGDNLFTFDLREQYECFRKIGSACIAVEEIDDVEALKSLGVCLLDKDNKVISFQEKPETPLSNLGVFATYFFKRDSLGYINDFLDEGIHNDAPGYFIEWLYKRVDVYAYIMNGDCYDIGTVAAYERIQRDFPVL